MNMSRYVKKTKKNKKLTTLITVESVDDFFRRGKKIAKLLDQKKAITPRRIISFEDVVEFTNFLTKNKLKLVSTIRRHPESISRLAVILRRSRAAIDKDVKALEAVGIVKRETIINPGHGRKRIIKITDDNPICIQMQAIL